jgi:hypothetical protein
MGRFATPDGVATAIAFVADPGRRGFVSGATLTVDGGCTADASRPSLPLTRRRPEPERRAYVQLTRS